MTVCDLFWIPTYLYVYFETQTIVFCSDLFDFFFFYIIGFFFLPAMKVVAVSGLGKNGSKEEGFQFFCVPFFEAWIYKN